jgi:hypothetical protein
MRHAVLGRHGVFSAVRGLFFVFLLLVLLVAAALVLEVNGTLVFMGLSVLRGSPGQQAGERRAQQGSLLTY